MVCAFPRERSLGLGTQRKGLRRITEVAGLSDMTRSPEKSSSPRGKARKLGRRTGQTRE